MGVTHTFVNPKADGADATVTRPSDWNADHTVSLTAADVGADPAGTAAAAIVTHDAAGDPHPVYLTAAEGAAAYDAIGAAAAAQAASQPLDSDLTAIAALATTSYGRSHLTEADAAAGIATLGLDADLATFALPASTTISAFGASLVDDAAATNARTTLGLVIGTDVAAQSVDAAQATGSLRTITTSAAQAVGTAAAGNGTAAASSNHVHPTGAGTPSTQAFGDAAATGTGPAAAMTDHKHAMMANPVPVTWTRASSFPGSPATGQIVIRSDINDMDFFYDGTRWRSKQVFTTQSDNVALMPQAVSGTAVVSGLWEPTYAVWLIEVRGMPYVSTTNNGTNFWTIAAVDFVTGSTLGSYTTAADTAGTATGHVAAIGASHTGAVGISVTKTLTPGTLYHNSFITYQIIAT